jgi:hypothetical protein
MDCGDFLSQVDLFLDDSNTAPMPKILEDYYTREQLSRYVSNDISCYYSYFSRTTSEERKRHKGHMRELSFINIREKSLESLQNLYRYMIDIGGRGVRRSMGLITRYNFIKFMKNIKNESTRKILTELFEDIFPGEVKVW